MNNVLAVIRHDIRRTMSSVMALIVLFGLVVIPSLFTWFNVIASWNPFDNTRNLTVAVANTDDGYQSDLVPIRLNVGEQVVSALRANDDLNWVITSEDAAIDGTRSGEYYAAIVLPPTFSADMMTFYTSGADRTRIDYYLNEKKNALAPKITGQGASEVSASINEVFTETLGEAGMNIISSLSSYLDDADTQAALSKLHARVESVGAQLRAGVATADMFTSLIASSTPLVDSASGLVTASGDALRDASGAIGGGKDAAASLKTVLSSTTASIDEALKGTSDSYQSLSDSIDGVFAAMDSQSSSAANSLRALADRVQVQIDQQQALRDGLVNDVRPVLPDSALAAFDSSVSRIDAAIARQQSLQTRLDEAATHVTDANAASQATRDEITALTSEAKAAIDAARRSYTDSLRPQLDALASTLASISDGVDSIGDELSSAARALRGSSSTESALARAETLTSGISDSLTATAARFDELAAALTTAIDTGDLSDLTALIGADPKALAAQLAEPVELTRVPVYSVVSFGAAMTPLYTVLALWVGALLTSVAIRVDPPRDGSTGLPELSPTETYLGRFGIFALIGFLQSSLVNLGSVFFTQVQPQHPFLLILTGWVTSLVFTLIIYTFVVTFGNAGKALAVLLLVIQISGSGGAYPLQVLPQWFQSISPFLPATHAVNAMRSAIAGVYENDYWVSLGWLASFAVPALLLGLVLRRPFIRSNQKMLAALRSTKLM
ncbi:putative membrane protein [Microbacterium keratanolyticum]|uniref:Phage infection protein n=1 Tax=Microbacterium keratanolyticum TaxID=67574 RepID=A0A9W6HQ05_9MICO|nr:YhgE/Pip domain-containing protein [Microbacterium keratanolyticum]MBM7468731.1 putative membrane protein [Microbacterium keratanolyticum]GLK00807.1 phage infection protein [Microbacterium keratanolyticum]